MSPKPSRVSPFPLEASGGVEDLVFGEEGRPSLLISKALLAQVWAQVTEGTRMLTRGGGLEVGGLLAGPKVRGGKVEVDEIIPLPIDYELGPSYQMSASDLERIVPAVEAVQANLSKVVVGFYRSRTRGDGTLRESDLEIVEAIRGSHTSFDADFRSCLVLAPVSESVALACIAMRYAGGWHEMQPFTLRSNPISIVAMPPSNALQPIARSFHSEDQAIQPASGTAALQPITEARISSRTAETRLAERRGTEQRLAEQRSQEQRIERPAAEQRTSENTAALIGARQGARRGKTGLYIAAALFGILAIAGVYRLAAKKESQSASNANTVAPRAHLGFSATREGPVWKLSWDRAAMDALNPIGAVLSIQDGGYQQQVPLATPDLASGTLFYTPQTSELTFNLRIDRGGSHVEETVRVLEAPKLGQRTVDRPAAASTRSSVQAPSQTALNGQGVTAAPAAAPVAAPATNPATPAKPSPRAFTPPPASAAEVPPADTTVPQPPAVVIAVPVPPTVGQFANLEAAPRPVPPPPPPAPTPAPPVAAAANNPAPAATKGPAPVPTPAPAQPAATPLKATYVGPKPIQQVRPQAPSNMPSGVSQVQVLVQIDASGKVMKVSPIGWTSTNAPLMSLAVRAASSWVFDPAQLNGKTVPSEMSLIFKF